MRRLFGFLARIEAKLDALLLLDPDAPRPAQVESTLPRKYQRK